MSTFSGLNTAYTALVAARAGIDVTGQNIANLNTEGYTRQRVLTSSISPVLATGILSTGVRPGQGVSVDGIARMGDVFLDARVRSAAAAAGYWSARAEVMTSIESVLQEPGENGLSAQLQEFWAGWQQMANRPDEPASAGMLLEQASVLVSQIRRGYQQVDAQWSQVREQAAGLVDELNFAAGQVAELNAAIRQALVVGDGVNELLDQRSLLTAKIASLAGGTVRHADDGTVEIMIGGNALVSAGTARPVELVGASSMDGLAADGPVALKWAHAEVTVSMDGGELAGALSMLAPAAAGSGGGIHEAATAYNDFASRLADAVNDVHTAGALPDGTTGHLFFEYDPADPARSLRVVPQGLDDIAAAEPGMGGYDGSVADRIAQLGVGAGSPNDTWAEFVIRTGVNTSTEIQQAHLAGVASESATNALLANSAVDIDEENVNLLTYQVAYQGAARVMTAVDEMLNTLINRTGLVGR